MLENRADAERERAFKFGLLISEIEVRPTRAASGKILFRGFSMAEMYKGCTCPLCRKEVNDIPWNTFATSGVVFPPEHRLFKFCDAHMHWDCYERWPDRIEFAHHYFQAWVEEEQDNPYWGKAFLSEKVFVTSDGVAEIAVYLAETGSDIRVPLKLWNIWIRSRWIVGIGRHPLEQKALREIWLELRNALPTSDLLIKAVDWAEKQQILDREKKQTRQLEEERFHKPKDHNQACCSLFQQGVICPFCNFADAQYIDQSPDGKSSFVCACCEQSFGPVEVSLKHLYG